MAKKQTKASAAAIAKFPAHRADAFVEEKGQTSEGLAKLIKKAEASKRLDDWSNVITGAGVAGRDKRLGGAANWAGIMLETEAEQLYASGELERRIVELIPRECLKNWIKFEGLEDGTSDVEEELDRLKVSSKFFEASCWARLYGGSALFMATGEDPEEFKKPLDPKRFDRIESLVLFSRWELLVRSIDLENDINNPNYGNPKYYVLTPRKGNVSNLNSVRIHHSRLIIFGGKPLPLRLKVLNQYWDDSVYSGIKSVLRDYGMSHAAIANVMQEFRQVVYKIKELSEGLATVDSAAVTQRLAAINAVKSVWGTYFLDMDEEMEIHSDTFTGVDGMLQAMKERMQACTDIPHIILFNESPGGKSSMGTTGDSSLESWYSYLEGHQKNYYAPKIDQLLVPMMEAGGGPIEGDVPEGWDWEFNKIQSMDEGQQAELEGKQYENDAKAQGLGIDSAYDTLQKRRPEKFKQLGLTDKDLFKATMQQLVRSEMEKLAPTADLEATGGDGLDMSDPLVQTRSASPPKSGPQQARGKRSDEEERRLDQLADLIHDLHETEQRRLDSNPNHDPKNGEFSTGPGGSGDLHHTAQAAKYRAKEAKLTAGGAHFSNPKRGAARDMAQFHEGLAHVYRGAPSVNNHLQSPARTVKSGSKEEFEKTVKTGSFTMLTAANPMSTPVTSKDNAARLANAMDELSTRGAKFTVMAGKYGAAEPTFMVFHDDKFSKQDARDLGKKWTQTSVMHVENGKATIYHTNGEHEGKVQRSNGLSFDPRAKDNYTGHGSNKFSFSFPDESWSNPEQENPS